MEVKEFDTLDECDEPDGPEAIPKYTFDFIRCIGDLELHRRTNALAS